MKRRTRREREPSEKNPIKKDCRNASRHGLWTYVLKPACTGDLTLSGKTVDDLSSALQKSRIVVVEGPSGSGKCSAVCTLSQELGYTVTEWDSPPFSTKVEHLAVSFANFLRCQTQTVSSADDNAQSDASTTRLRSTSLSSDLKCQKTPRRHVLLVRDFPYTMCTTSDRLLLPSRAALLQHALQEFLSFQQRMSVLVLLLGHELVDRRILYSVLLPLQTSGSLCHIKVASPTTTALKRVIKRILLHEGFSLSKIRDIQRHYFQPNHGTSNHNISSFLTEFQFFHFPKLRDGLSLSTRKSNSLMSARDHRDDIMHTVARILWNKRLDPVMLELPSLTSEKTSPELYLRCLPFIKRPVFFASQVAQNDLLFKTSSVVPIQLDRDALSPKLFRPPLYFDLDGTLESLISEIPVIVDLLYSNFPLFYSSLADASELLSEFSFADAYLRRSYGSETQSWDNQVANIVCCKAVLDCNLQPRTPTKSDESETAFSHDLLNNRQPVSKNVSPVLSKFFSLQKSKICDIQRQQVTARDVVLHSKALQAVLPTWGLWGKGVTTSIASEVLPFMCLASSYQPPHTSLISFLSQLGHLDHFTTYTTWKATSVVGDTVNDELTALEIDESELEPEDDIQDVAF